MRSLTDFQSRGRSIESQFRKAIDSMERFHVPAGVWVVDEPLEFEHCLRMTGEMGYAHANIPHTEIRGTVNLGDRPLFHRKGAYLRYTDGRNEWVGSHPEKAGTGLKVQVEHCFIRSLSEHNSALQVFNSTQSYVKNCEISGAFRGLDCINTFGMVLENLRFTAPFRNDWLEDDQRVRNAWGLHVTNNCTITECNWQGGLTALVVNGAGNRMHGGRIERNIYGIIMGVPNLNPSPGAFGIPWLPMSSELYGFTMESNLRQVTARVGHSCSLRNFSVIGTNAPQIDKTDGPCDWGINSSWFDPNSESKGIVVSGAFRQGAMVDRKWSGVKATNSIEVTP